MRLDPRTMVYSSLAMGLVSWEEESPNLTRFGEKVPFHTEVLAMGLAAHSVRIKDLTWRTYVSSHLYYRSCSPRWRLWSLMSEIRSKTRGAVPIFYHRCCHYVCSPLLYLQLLLLLSARRLGDFSLYRGGISLSSAIR